MHVSLFLTPSLSNCTSEFRELYGSYCVFYAGRISQSVQRLATGWTVRGSDAGGGEIFRIVQNGPWGPPSLLYNEYRVFPRGKAAGAWC
jgi:hypothetical protein